jgi:hypothetical protein
MVGLGTATLRHRRESLLALSALQVIEVEAQRWRAASTGFAAPSQ